MTQRSKVLALALVLVVLALGALRSAAIATVPSDAVTAEQSLKVWLKTLKGKSLAQIEKELGPPQEKATWSFMGATPPLYHYKTPGGAALDFYFAEGRAVNVSLLLMTSQ